MNEEKRLRQFAKFLRKARLKHGDLFEYDEDDYINASINILIRCNVCGYTFTERPKNHLFYRERCHSCKSTKDERYDDEIYPEYFDESKLNIKNMIVMNLEEYLKEIKLL